MTHGLDPSSLAARDQTFAFVRTHVHEILRLAEHQYTEHGTPGEDVANNIAQQLFVKVERGELDPSLICGMVGVLAVRATRKDHTP